VAIDASVDHINRKLRCLLHCALHQRTIRLTCPRCKRERRFDAVALWWLFERRHEDDAFPAVLRRFYCSVCKAGGAKVRPRYEITTEPPDADQPPYPSQSEWKRQINRYRS
jgi:type II secretory ATPase GspE/PulE/Tfp pilus assembly ATPase PilB-like protein